MKTYYRRNLPHIQPVGAGFFITFRLHNSIPKSVLFNLSQEYNDQKFELNRIPDQLSRNDELEKLKWLHRQKHEEYLHKIQTGPNYLLIDEIAQIISDELFRWDGKLYNLICFTIMSNHVHILIDTSCQLKKGGIVFSPEKTYVQLDQILKRIKGATAVYCNKYLNRKGQFWERESWDIYIRNNNMLERIISYILNNPVKSGIVEHWEDYKWNYWKKDTSH